jgi:hypothetical protein
MITISLENMKRGIRVTARHNGRTIIYKEGNAEASRNLVSEVMADACSAHRKGNGDYDMTYIELNDAAASAI